MREESAGGGIKRLLLVLGMVVFNSGVFASTYDQLPQIKLNPSKQLGSLPDKRLREISGMVSSPLHPEWIWALNDGGNSSRVFRLTRSGEITGVIKLPDIKNIDWEDLTAVVVDGTSYLIIADIGDNWGARESVRLIVIAEPDLPVSRKPVLTKATAIIDFKYEDGARDAESLAVDIDAKKILVLSKRDSPAGLYELPLQLDASLKPLIAKKIGSLTGIPQPGLSELTEHWSLFMSQPTAMDIRGNRMLVLTYKYAYLYERKPKQTWRDVVAGSPALLRIGRLDQQESVAWLPVENSFLYSSEGISSPLIHVSW